MKRKAKQFDGLEVVSNPYIGRKLKFELAPTRRLTSLQDITEDFMKQILKYDPEDYLITDESRLSDFTDFARGDIAPYLPKIKKHYGVDVSDVPYGNLAGIFRKIKDAQKCRTASNKKKTPNQAL